MLVPVDCQSLFVHIDAFIACLFKQASDEDPSVRRHVCQALVLVLAARSEKLIPELQNVTEYMLGYVRRGMGISSTLLSITTDHYRLTIDTYRLIP